MSIITRNIVKVCVATLVAIAPAAVAAEQMRLAHIYQADSPSGRGFDFFAKRVNELTDGNLTVKVFPAAQLGNMRKIFTSLKTGAIDFAVTPFPFLADTVPEYTVMLAGYTFRDMDHISNVLEDKNLGAVWKQKIENLAGLKILGYYYYGSRVVTVKDKPFHNPEEASGLKLRSPQHPMSLAVIEGLGANPTPMAFPELFMGLSQGVVDGQENPYPTIFAQKFYEVQDYVIETNHQISAPAFSISVKSWKKHDKQQQLAIQTAATEAMDHITQLTITEEKRLRDELEKGGMTIIPSSELDMAAFGANVRKNILEEFEGSVWPEGLMEKVIAVQ